MARPKSCRVCGRTGIDINGKRRCLSCAMNKVIAVNKQLMARKGKHYKKWKRNTIAAIKRM